MRGVFVLFSAVWVGVSCLMAQAEEKTISVLAVGNSFSRNAMHYFPEIVQAAGCRVVATNAYIGGCDFERHVRHAEAFEADPNDPEGRPYPGKLSLKDFLTMRAWDYVTIQQVSHKSFSPETYHPAVDKLVAYIRKYAPKAEIVIHQTWAYRDDHPWFVDRAAHADRPATPDEMYKGLRAGYDGLAKEFGFRLIPSGDAMETARRDPAWGKFQPDPAFDEKTAVYPALPAAEKFALHNGFGWRKNEKTGAYTLGKDCIHANTRGEYLQGCVWFEFFFGKSVEGNTFVPKGMTADEAAVMQRIAHRVVTEKKRPDLLP